MPRGQPVQWTRELLEEVEVASGETDVAALAERLGLAPATIYSVKGRISGEGIDEILRRQAHRYEAYTRGGGAKPAETLDDQLRRVYNITAASGGRDRSVVQYTVTIPSRVGEAWVKKWGRQVRYRAVEEGLLILPLEPESPEDKPSWLSDNGSEPA